MSFLKKLSAPKAKIELKLDEIFYDSKDKLTGRIVLEPEEDIAVSEFRVEFGGNRKVKYKKGLSSYSQSPPLAKRVITVGSAINLQKGQQYEQPFQVDIPQHTKSDPFTEIEMKVEGVAEVQGRRNLTAEMKPGISFPYEIECISMYGGCGFKTQPLPQPITTCPQCNANLEEVWKRKYKDLMKSQQQSSRSFSSSSGFTIKLGK